MGGPMTSNQLNLYCLIGEGHQSESFNGNNIPYMPLTTLAEQMLET